MVNYKQEQLDHAFAALADPTRRAMVARLAQGEATVGDLAAPHAMSLPAVSKHLKVLERAGLVARRKDGRVHHCRLEPAPLLDAVAWIESHRRFWEARLDALDDYLNSTKQKEDDHGTGK
jgi:DNA-binding transcriptional ArsR family regulator